MPEHKVPEKQRSTKLTTDQLRQDLDRRYCTGCPEVERVRQDKVRFGSLYIRYHKSQFEPKMSEQNIDCSIWMLYHKTFYVRNLFCIVISWNDCHCQFFILVWYLWVGVAAYPLSWSHKRGSTNLSGRYWTSLEVVNSEKNLAYHD